MISIQRAEPQLSIARDERPQNTAEDPIRFFTQAIHHSSFKQALSSNLLVMHQHQLLIVVPCNQSERNDHHESTRRRHVGVVAVFAVVHCWVARVASAVVVDAFEFRRRSPGSRPSWNSYYRYYGSSSTSTRPSFVVSENAAPAKSSNFREDPSGSLSHLVSSSERYALALNATVMEIEGRIQERLEAVRELQERLSFDNTLTGEDRHRVVCEHRLRHGKHPFVCEKCWCYQPICLCGELSQRSKVDVPCGEVIVWTNQKEWGSPSNTGSLLPLMLRNTRLWMKGLDDDKMAGLVAASRSRDDGRFAVVLWPRSRHLLPPLQPQSGPKNSGNDDDDDDDNRFEWLDAQQLLRHVPASNISLIVLEGTWQQANRMASKLRSLPRLSIDASAVLAGSGGETRKSSLLQPLRRNSRSLCTAEAVIAACGQLSLAIRDNNCSDGGSSGCSSSRERSPHFEQQSLLYWVRRKVDLTRRYQGKRLSS